jgi:hypothetical protein
MPFDLPLPRKLKAAGWKVKIREKERVEPPHVTVMHKADQWRLGLRERQLLVPPGGRIKDIDQQTHPGDAKVIPGRRRGRRAGFHSVFDMRFQSPHFTFNIRPFIVRNPPPNAA